MLSIPKKPEQQRLLEEPASNDSGVVELGVCLGRLSLTTASWVIALLQVKYLPSCPDLLKQMRKSYAKQNIALLKHLFLLFLQLFPTLPESTIQALYCLFGIFIDSRQLGELTSQLIVADIQVNEENMVRTGSEK